MERPGLVTSLQTLLDTINIVLALRSAYRTPSEDQKLIVSLFDVVGYISSFVKLLRTVRTMALETGSPLSPSPVQVLDKLCVYLPHIIEYLSLELKHHAILSQPIGSRIWRSLASRAYTRKWIGALEDLQVLLSQALRIIAEYVFSLGYFLG